MRVSNWNPEKFDSEIINASMDRLEIAAEVVKKKAQQLCPVGKISRPVAERGKFAGKYWTAREPGSLKKTIRVTRLKGDPRGNILVMAGNKKVFYAQIVEFKNAFLRPALNGSKSEIFTIIKEGVTMKGGTF